MSWWRVSVTFAQTVEVETAGEAKAKVTEQVPSAALGWGLDDLVETTTVEEQQREGTER